MWEGAEEEEEEEMKGVLGLCIGGASMRMMVAKTTQIMNKPEPRVALHSHCVHHEFLGKPSVW
jgi:hypothetical protein